MRAIYRKIRYARYLYIKRNVEKFWGARYTLSARYISKNSVCVCVCVYIYIYKYLLNGILVILDHSLFSV